MSIVNTSLKDISKVQYMVDYWGFNISGVSTGVCEVTGGCAGRPQYTRELTVTPGQGAAHAPHYTEHVSTKV